MTEAENKKYLIESGRALFEKECKFVIGCAWLAQLPESNLMEVAFAGRSNVGKSSLINALTRQRDMARASATPGRTQQLNYFLLNDQIYIVDLPGYGYANAPKQMVEDWNKLVLTYLQGRPSLRRVFMLIDSRHGPNKKDEEVMKLLEKAAVVFQVILTKADKLGDAELQKSLAHTQKVIGRYTTAYPKVIVTSAEKNIGIEDLRAEVAELLTH